MKTKKFVNKMVQMYAIEMQKRHEYDDSLNSLRLKEYVSDVCDLLKKREIISEYTFGDTKLIADTRLVEFNLYYELQKEKGVYHSIGLVAVDN